MMNKTILCIALGSAGLGTTTSAISALSADALLNFDTFVTTTSSGSVFVTGGSFFAMDTNGSGTFTKAERTGLEQNNGIFVNKVQAAAGSHTGAPGCIPSENCKDTAPSSESPAADLAWNYFGNTGMHGTTVATTVSNAVGNTADLDFSGWTVFWNTVAINMGSGDSAGVASVVCEVDCAVGDRYSIDYFATVPDDGLTSFGGVKYTVHLEGEIGECTGDSTPPTAANDNYEVATNTVTSMVIAANDADVGCAKLDKTNIDLDPAAEGKQTSFTTINGSVTVDEITGVVTYTPTDAFQGLDEFDYTISDFAGNTSGATTVDIAVGDVPPTCNNDGVADGAYIDLSIDTSVNINVLANDIERSNAIVPSTVTVVSDVTAAQGTTTLVGDGTITFTAAEGFSGTASFTYSVTDDGATPLTCDVATVRVLASAAGDPIGGVENGFLVLTSGPVGDVTKQPVLGEGSWFSMELSPGKFTYVPLVGFNHIELGTAQPALAPNMTDIDSPWGFFGSLGLHQTTGVLEQLSNDGAGNALLDFSVWDVTWNSIASIPMGAGQDNGIATMTCYTNLLAATPGTCGDGDEYLLTYRAIVPVGDTSGFGGVNYALHLEGSVSATAPIVGCGNEAALYDVDTVSVIGDCTSKQVLSLLPGATAAAVGNTTGLNLSASDTGKKDPFLNAADGVQCAGGCLDFVIKQVPTGEAQLVVKLSAPISQGAVYRKLVNGKWQDFDVSDVDAVGSAEAVGGMCPGPDGVYRIGLRAGYECLYLKITDGGPNDADGMVNGTIVDPSGVLLPGSPNTPASATGGCSISNTSVKLSERADWFIVAGFIAWLGLIGYRRNKSVN